MAPRKIFRTSLQLVWQRFLECCVFRRQIEKYYLVMGGHIFFQTLSAAVQLDLFTLLARRAPLTQAGVSSALHIDEKPARILLLGCTALGLVRKNGDLYSNTRMANELLNRDKQRNICPVIAWQHFINYRPLYAFVDALKANKNVGLAEFAGEGGTLYERLAGYPELEKIFQQAMEGISAQANHLLVEAVDFGAFSHVLDVGGGNGTNVIELAQRYPSLKATVFDSASVGAIARASIAKAGLDGRVDAVAGDCFEDPFPKGVDCILFAHFMTIWSEAKNRALLRKAFEALPPGGAVMVFNMMQRNDRTGPLSAAMGSPYFLTLATGEGMLYTWSEYETWMKDAGFATVTRRQLVRDHGIILGLKG